VAFPGTQFFVVAWGLLIAGCGASQPLFDGGGTDPGQVLNCDTTVQTFCGLGNALCLQTSSDVEAVSCADYGCLAGVFTDSCGGYRVVTCGAGDRAYSGFLDADSGHWLRA